MRMRQFNRREFLLLSTSTFVTVWLANCRLGQPKAASSDQPVVTQQPGLSEFVLAANNGPVKLANRQAYLLNYNGQIPGPRLETKAGDTVRIRLINNIGQPTNLHYHGLHIPPTGQADNIFRHVPNGESSTYEFTIPQNHPAGTFYYHPHLHEMTAEQVFGGLGGIFVVRGELDQIPEIQAAKEEFLFLKDFALDANGQVVAANPMARMQGREGLLITVNGQVNPNLAIAAGGLLRLRLLNASSSRFYRLALQEHPFFLIATDGGAISEPVELKELLLAPGERAEVLVQGDRQPGQYSLLNLPYNRGGGMAMMGRGGMGGMMHPNPESQSQTPQILATLVYQGLVSPLPLPQKLISVETLPAPQTVRRLELSMAMGMMGGMGSGMGMTFLFNGKAFDPQRVDASVKLGQIEDWDLVNVDSDRMDHPFHLHVNPFQVVSRDGQPEPYRAWKDTVLVRSGETVRIRIPFRDFAGKTVYHCHILDHEDLGMMGLIEMKA
jgi:FtsP/CotA-like multicopper oxidase with cupredoxin domain